MQNRTTTTVRIILTIALSSLLTMSVQAQERSDLRVGTSYEVYGYPLGVSELVHTDSLSASKKEAVDKVRAKLDVLAPLLELECRDNSIATDAYSDYHRYKGVSKAMSDLLNDKLAWHRKRKVHRYLIDVKGVPEDCFRNGDIVYADSQVRGVHFRIIRKALPTAGGVDKGVIDEINERISTLEDDIRNLREDMEEKNDKQNERIAENEGNISENTQRSKENSDRIDDLEDQDQSSFSIGTKVTRFAGQYTPVGEIGIPYGPLEFSLWSGGWKNYTAKLDEGDTTYNRFMVGTSISYLWNPGSFKFGPRLGVQFTKDEVSPDCRVLYYSAMAGFSAEYSFAGNWSIYGDASLVTGFEDIQGDLDPDAGWFIPSAGIRYQVTFN